MTNIEIVKITVDALFAIGCFINALVFIPQLLVLYQEKNAKNLSLLSFLGFNFIQFGLMVHGIFYDDLFLAIGMGLTLLTCGSVTLLIILYRSQEKRASL